MSYLNYGFGSIPSPVDVRDYKLVAKAYDTSILPETFTLDVLKIKNQGMMSTCVAHALSELMEHQIYKDTKDYEELSTDFIYGCRRDTEYKEEGMYIRDALSNAKSYGDVFLDELPGNSLVGPAIAKFEANFENLKDRAYENRISTYYRITSENELKLSLYNHGPVIAGMKWYSNCSFDNEYHYSYYELDSFTGHAVLIIGWDKDSWIIQNSWGREWGDNGLFKICIENSLGTVFYEAYGVTDDIVAVKRPNKAKIRISPFLNFFLNKYRKL